MDKTFLFWYLIIGMLCWGGQVIYTCAKNTVAKTDSFVIVFFALVLTFIVNAFLWPFVLIALGLWYKAQSAKSNV